MKRTDAQATAAVAVGARPPDMPGAWATDAAASVLERSDVAQQQRETEQAAAARLTALVETEGRLWFDRVAAELRAAAAAFNTRVGRPAITVIQSPTGRLIMTAADRNAGSVAVQPLLTTGVGQFAPGAFVTVDKGGCANRIPYDFDVADDQLSMRTPGGSLGPEAFAQVAATSWMATLALGGR